MRPGSLAGLRPAAPHLSQQTSFQELVVGLGRLLEPVVFLQVQGFVIQGKGLCFL